MTIKQTYTVYGKTFDTLEEAQAYSLYSEAEVRLEGLLDKNTTYGTISSESVMDCIRDNPDTFLEYINQLKINN